MRKPSASASGPNERCRRISSARMRAPLIAAVVLLVALAVAAATQASSRIIGYFQLGGEFEGAAAQISASSVAINAAGTGGASPGDVYVFSGAVRQLSAADDFIRMWGADVVKKGPDQANETQAVRVDATGGAFRLGFDANTTADIPAAATAAQVEAALNALPSIGPGGTSVSGGPGGAGGANPYVIAFDGAALEGANQPQLKATTGSTPLIGGTASVSAYTTNNGGIGFEVCEPASGDECNETARVSSEQVAVNQDTGDLYVTESNRIDRYSATGQFLGAWGKDAVTAGPDDSSSNEQKSVTVIADGGTFTLGYREAVNAPVQRTPALPFNAPPAAVETALNNLDGIGGNYSSVTVTGGPGDLIGSSPYVITFHGLLGGDDLPDGAIDSLLANPNSLTISSGTKSAAVETVTDGGGYEFCKAADACREGSEKDSVGILSVKTFGSSLAVAPPGAPNAGDVIFGDGQPNRVQEFTPEGAFVRTFGWDVDATDLSTGFEVCTAESGHICQEGSSGAGVGQFGRPNSFTLQGVAEDSGGTIYTAEDTGSFKFTGLGDRVQRFTPAGGLNLTPSPFGTIETQALKVNAGAGEFRLVFGSEGIHENFFSLPVEGFGDLTQGSTTITNVTATKGAFEVGMPIMMNGGSLSEDTVITAVGPNSLTISKPAVTPGSSVPLRSGRSYKTPSLPFNASAGEVESALNSLPSIEAHGGSVSVAGGPGDIGGLSPYLITFDGGPLVRTDPPQIAVANGATPLTAGSGAGANTATVTTAIPGGPSGVEADSSPIDVAVGSGGHVFVARYFPPLHSTCSDGLPSPPEIRIEELDSSGAVLGTSDPCIGLSGFKESLARSLKLTANPVTGRAYLLADNPFQTSRVNIFGPLGLLPSFTLDSVSNISSKGGTISGTVNPNGPGISYPATTGTPSVTKTTYRIEYKKSADSAWTKYTPDLPIGNGTSPVAFSVGIGSLAPKTEYELRVVVTKPFTGSVEDTTSFTTQPAAPEIEALSSSDVTVNAANLNAIINPQGSATSYHFEYGTTPAYGQSTPETSIGEAHSGQAAQNHIDGLQDTVYHFRVVATNASGISTSSDQTFNFHPPVCPNQTVRQQTGAAYLPDCRAYELVSPEDAGGATLFTGGPQSPYATNPPRLAFVGWVAAIPGSGRNPINTVGDLYVATRSAEGWHTRYIGPSSEEAGCVGGRPLVSGASTRTTVQNDVIANSDLSRIIDWNLGNPPECITGSFGDLRLTDYNTAARGSNAPYVWNAHGDFLDRWPTAAGDRPGSEENFACPQDPAIHPYPPGVFGNIPVSYFCSTYVDASKDLNHFVFSTQSGLFGEGGLNVAPGSAYDNNTARNTLKLISKQPNGEPIDQEPGEKAGPEELIQFPAVSTDGSHILMGTATKPACKHVDYPHLSDDEARALCPILTQPTHLYMRVNDALTYDVSAGRPVHYVGATPDATKVYFTSDEQVTGDDTDTSTDLYRWSENNGNPQLTRISVGDGGPAGNIDECVATWTTNCDIETYKDSSISVAPGNQGGLGSWHPTNQNPGYTDNAIAAKSGDIYFYSPEQLVADRGAPGKENLYVYRNESVRHVATLEDDRYCLVKGPHSEPTCSNGAVGRLQVTPDGHYAAFVTTSRITAYANHGFAEMYRYNAETEKIECVSCRPDGTAPEGDVLGSEGGRFITDDGRVFFDTPEPLVSRDTNAGYDSFEEISGNDVYEFVDGRPQLISTGTGELRSLKTIGLSLAGLYGVSADGVDVYFGSFETLVGQDQNGQQLKFYDARTNGGFSFVPPPALCAAADECHGPTAGAPVPMASGTTAALGGGGNTTHAKHRKHRQKHRKHRQKHRKSKRVKRDRHKVGGVR